MISKNTIKRLNSLSLKKYRNKEKLFLVEGDKMVQEIIHSSLSVKEIYATPEFKTRSQETALPEEKITLVDYSELKKISQLKTPQNAIAVCELPEQKALPETLNDNLSLYLDGVQDPGNLGTIIRICDWYGVQHVFYSPNTVDLYNPKVIQASMGSFMRVSVYECELDKLKPIAQNSGATVYGAFMEGKNVYHAELASKAILVMGNEGNGIREESKNLIDQKISIPNFSESESKAESLNVSVATAILCSEFKRR